MLFQRNYFRATTIGAALVILLISPVSRMSGGEGAPLVEAVKEGNGAAIRSLVDEHVDVNVPAVDGTTALHWAARRNDVVTAELLIQAGADVNRANRYLVRPLSLACHNGDLRMIELLLDAGADPNTALPGGETALMTAARTGRVPAVSALLGRGANVNDKEDGRGQTALMWAASEGHAAVVEALIEHGADIGARSKAGFTALLFAVREGAIEVVRVLLKAGGDVNERLPRAPGVNALTLAVENAHYELAVMLLDAGAKENTDELGWTLLHELTWVRKPGSGSNPLPARGSGDMDSLDFARDVVRRGADLNARITKKPHPLGTTRLNVMGATPFLMAARTADVPLMRLLAELGADPLMPNADSSTPLMVAAGVGTLQFGEDPGTEDEVLEAVKLAVELGGDVNAVDSNGETAIHGAAYKEVPSVVEYLLTKGARIEVWNRENKLGWTPLRISEGVVRGQSVRHLSPATAAVIRRAMEGAGVFGEAELRQNAKSSGR